MKYRYRPQYFAEVWRPGEPSLAIPLACKGNHSDPATSAEQLASAPAHAEAVHIGAWNQTLSLLFSTQLPTDGDKGEVRTHAAVDLSSTPDSTRQTPTSLVRAVTSRVWIAPIRRRRNAVAPDSRQQQLGPPAGRDRRLRLARNAHTDMRTLRATAPGAQVDSAQSAGKAAGPQD